jgi:hypothetical protein
MTDTNLAFVCDTPNAKVCGFVARTANDCWEFYSTVTIGCVSFKCYPPRETYDSFDAAYAACKKFSHSMLTGEFC